MTSTLRIIMLKDYYNQFNRIEHFNEEIGIYWWNASELAAVLDCSWKEFEKLYLKATIVCKENDYPIEDHFRDTTKMVDPLFTDQPDIKLSRYACYLIAQNGSSETPKFEQALDFFEVGTAKWLIK
jgi:DNA-damage-inducible protein D